MRTPEVGPRMLSRTLKLAAVLCFTLLTGAAFAAEEHGEEGGAIGDSWKHWHSKNEVSNITSLQRGARNFVSYCQGCHAMKYVRYSRMAEDLQIPEADLERLLL